MDGLEERIARLEATVEAMKEDIGEVKSLWKCLDKKIDEMSKHIVRLNDYMHGKAGNMKWILTILVTMNGALLAAFLAVLRVLAGG